MLSFHFCSVHSIVFVVVPDVFWFPFLRFNLPIDFENSAEKEKKLWRCVLWCCDYLMIFLCFHAIYYLIEKIKWIEKRLNHT